MANTIIALIGRILLGIIQQPGVQDVATAVARRIIRQTEQRIIHAINQRTKIRQGMETFH